MQTAMHVAVRPNRIRRTPLDFAALFVMLLAGALASAILIWQFWHVNRIYTGVTIAGVPVGGLTRARAVNELSQQLLRYPLPPLLLSYEDRQWPVTADQVWVTADLLTAVNRAYLAGRQGDALTKLTEQLRAALRGHEITPPVEFDAGQLRYAVDRIANQVHKPSRAGAQIGEVTVPAQTGVDVDVEATVQALSAALHNGAPGEVSLVPLQVHQTAPPAMPLPTPETDVSSDEPVLHPLLVRDAQSGLEMAIDPAGLDEIIFSTEPFRLDEDALAALLGIWAQQIAIPARDARLRFDPDTGAVSVVQPSHAGRTLDVNATLESVRTALSTGGDEATLVVNSVAPAVDMNRIAEMGIRELVASGVTYFAGSSAARVRNIEVAAEKFEGVVVPPGAIFSFNKIVQDVSSANGFEDSLVIWGDRTAVGVGGGVCQVSTTVFRAAYLAGLPIVERYNHGYVVDWYGEPGLDATVFTPSVDFRFRNDTGAHLLIDPVMDAAGGVITFNLYGTKPDREVTLSAPIATDVVEAPAAVYEVDESLAVGERKQVDWAKKGMTVMVQRTIVENGQTRSDTLTSKYQPWRAVYLVGPGTDVPAGALPTPTPQP